MPEIHSKKQIKSECDYIGFRYNRLNYKCKDCENIYHKSINGLIKKCPRIYKFYNGDLSKFALSLRKVVYLYEYMDSCERFYETSLPDKKSLLQPIKSILQRICKILLIKTMSMLKKYRK